MAPKKGRKLNTKAEKELRNTRKENLPKNPADRRIVDFVSFYIATNIKHFDSIQECTEHLQEVLTSYTEKVNAITI